MKHILQKKISALKRSNYEQNRRTVSYLRACVPVIGAGLEFGKFIGCPLMSQSTLYHSLRSWFGIHQIPRLPFNVHIFNISHEQEVAEGKPGHKKTHET